MLFIINSHAKHLTTDEHMNKDLYVHLMGYYLALTTNHRYIKQCDWTFKIS